MSGGIISIHVGHCGNKIGSSFWDMISRDQGIDQQNLYAGNDLDFQLEKVDVYYKESMNFKFFPRAIFADLDNESTEDIKSSTFYSKNKIISVESTKKNNFASVFFDKGHEIIESIIESIREEAEECDSVSGFHLFHSLGGGTGSGLTSMILNELCDEYPDQIKSTFSIFPSKKVDNYYIEPYNCILNLNHLIQSADEVFYFDNEELYDLCISKNKTYNPTFNDLNCHALYRMSSITSSLRFPNQLNSDLKKIYTNIIPFQHLKFINSYFETNQYHGSCIRPSDVKCLLSFLLGKKEKYIRACGYVNFNGRFQTNEVKEEMDIINSKENPDLKFSVCENYFGFKGSATLVDNSTKIIKILENQKENFLNFYKKRTNIHLFINEGLDSVDFNNANTSITNIIQHYEDLCHINEEYNYI